MSKVTYNINFLGRTITGVEAVGTMQFSEEECGAAYGKDPVKFASELITKETAKHFETIWDWELTRNLKTEAAAIMGNKTVTTVIDTSDLVKSWDDEATRAKFLELKDDKSEYSKVLVVSTAHMPRTEADKLTSRGLGEWQSEFGYMIPTYDGDHDAMEGFCIEIINILLYAHDNGCGYVIFDRDGPTRSDFPVFDW